MGEPMARGGALPSGPAPRGTAFDVAGLARVTAELGAAVSLDEVVEAAVTHITDAIGAAVATLILVEGDVLRMVGFRGVRPGVEQAYATFALADGNPAAEAALSLRPVLVPDADAMDARYPAMRGQLPRGRSLVALPVPVLGAPPAGAVLGLTFDDEWLPDPVQSELLATFAVACGQTLDRLAATERATRQSDQLRFLAEASEALASSLDFRETLQTVASLAVPGFADWCAVDLAGEAGPTTVAIAHADPAKVRWAWRLQVRYPTDPDASTGSPNVIRTGRSELYPDIPDELLVASARDAEHLQLARELQMRSAITVPLTARGHTHGALTLIRTDAARAYDEADLAFAEDLGRRAGLAVDNATLFARARDVAVQLQHAVLPLDAIDLPGWDVATHYSAAGTAEVGGDFFDAIALPDGRLAVVIGDVMGHGLTAAAGMAQLRAATRAYLVDDPDPVRLLTRLDRLFEQAPPTRMASMVVAVVDPGGDEVSLVNAGHYPPLVVDPDGVARPVWTESRTPLGAGPAAARVSTFAFPPASVLLLYTDGLVERRGEVLDVGLARLAEHAGRLTAPGPLPSALAELIAGFEVGGADDVAAVAVRRHAEQAVGGTPRLCQTSTVAGLEIDTEDVDGRVVAHLSGSLDLATVEAWREAAAPILDDARTTELTVDAADLGFVDSTGIGGIIDVANLAGAAGKSFRVTGVRPEVARVLDLVGLSHLHDRPTPSAS